jgi:hypothetical protein
MEDSSFVRTHVVNLIGVTGSENEILVAQVMEIITLE